MSLNIQTNMVGSSKLGHGSANSVIHSLQEDDICLCDVVDRLEGGIILLVTKESLCMLVWSLVLALLLLKC